MDSAGSDRSQRRTALVGRSIRNYDMQIAALSEIQFTEAGRSDKLVLETGGKQEFALPFSKLSELPKGITDHLMTLRLPL